jgi:ATP-binding cassette subfamily C (CFTR/MRP) protein 1
VGETSNTKVYLLAYDAIGVCSSRFNGGSQMVLKLFCGLRSSRKLYDDSFSALMRSPLSFFELTPTGRILNLFSRDIFVIDEVLIIAFSSFVPTVSAKSRWDAAVTAHVPPAHSSCRRFIAFGAPLVLIVFVPLGFIYRMVMRWDIRQVSAEQMLIYRYYLATSRELKCLDAISRSPIFSFFGETLAGLPVIRVSSLRAFAV